MNKLSIIFLDVDGVLNTIHTKDCINGYIGIDSKKVKVLKQIVDQTNATIVLSSSWKREWYKNNKYYQDDFANYLDNKLKEYNLTIFDKTNDGNSWNRGQGIIDYINLLSKQGYEINHILILDDICFDYKEMKLTKYWLTTNYYGNGLNSKSVNHAKEILKEEFNLKEFL